jgi:hypothetical protein
MENTENKKLQDGLDEFIGITNETDETCVGPECKLKSKDGLIERVRINKQIIVEDGRQLLV